MVQCWRETPAASQVIPDPGQFHFAHVQYLTLIDCVICHDANNGQAGPREVQAVEDSAPASQVGAGVLLLVRCSSLIFDSHVSIWELSCLIR